MVVGLDVMEAPEQCSPFIRVPPPLSGVHAVAMESRWAEKAKDVGRERGSPQVFIKKSISNATST